MIHNHEVPGSIPGLATRDNQVVIINYYNYFFIGEYTIEYTKLELASI